ncbi:MAG: glycosyltransferase [Cyanobacteria bacterium SID2]|nr:glycosyltransferase [Cyanobacteria bacterium SID2]MBP0005463.1 glycosyltransferase [Cyanobacteria bacterium SBC]
MDKSAKSSIPYLSPDILATIVVSEHNRKILNFTYPELPVFRIYCGLDRDRFSFCDLSEKKKQIAANPNKNASEILSVYQILRSRAVRGLNHLLDWDWVWIEGKSESEVTQILKDSAIFVSLSLHEGFGLLPLEAMASGCLTLSYGLEPMTEYLPSDSQIQPGNLQKVVCHIEALADKFLKKPSELQVLTRRCRDIATAYSPQREIDSVISTWNAILDQNFDVETECPSYPKVLF